MSPDAKRLMQFLMTRWLFTSLCLGLLALGIDAGLLAAARGRNSPGMLVDDGSVIAGALTVSVEWLLLSWMAVATDAWRRGAVVANAVVVAALVVTYASLRVDVLLVNDVIFGTHIVRLVTIGACGMAGLITCGSAVLAGLPSR